MGPTSAISLGWTGRKKKKKKEDGDVLSSDVLAAHEEGGFSSALEVGLLNRGGFLATSAGSAIP